MNTKDNDQLSGYQDKDSEEERWKNIFDHYYDLIADRMSPDFGLIDKLYSKSAIACKEKEQIKAEKTAHERNETLIKCLGSRSQLGKLIEALRESDQRHLVKYLENDGNYNDKFDGEWPLTEKEISTIKSNYESLIDLVEINDLIDRLYSARVINNRQKKFISSKSTSYEKNEAFLEIVMRGSLRSYWQTIRCLHQSNQSHIAVILEAGGVAMRVDANLELENMDIGRSEEEMALQINNLLRNRSITQSSRILERVLELKLIAAKKGHSVSLYFLCNQSNEVDNLEKMATDGRLKEFVEVLFNELMKAPKTIKITPNWTPDVLLRCREAAQEMKNPWTFKINISDFLLEVIDIILEKSYLLSTLRQKQSSQNEKDEVAIKLLASVDFCWFQRIARKHFKNVVWSKMKRYYENKCKQCLIYKNNQQFFEEIRQIRGKTTEHLSNSESTNRKRKRSLKKRQTENQMLRTAFLAPETAGSVFKDFLSSCDPKQQELIQKIINSGGGSARIEIKMSRPLTDFELTPQQFEDKEMKILRSLADRDTVVWIWCHSNNALQKLNSRDGLKKLIEIVRQTVKATSDVLEHRTNIDYDHLKKKIVRFPLMMVDFVTELNFHRESKGSYSESNLDRVIGITKLKRKIYVLCVIRSLTKDASLSTIICVFEDRSPYTVVEEISLSGFDDSEFKSIVSSVKDNCLYLLTSSVRENHYVFEVIRVEIKENEEDFFRHHPKWLELEEGYRSYVLSISRDGDLMMVNSSPPIILRIYDSDARLRLSVKLHEDIKEAHKALETSNGNFIIMHEMKQQTQDAVSEEMNECNIINKRVEEDDDRAIEEDSSSFDKAFVYTVSEVSRNGKTIIRSFIPQNQQQQLYTPSFSYEAGDLCTDSRDRVFVADIINDRVIVLDSYLRWIGILIQRDKNDDENEKLLRPLKLFYDENSHEMIITEIEQIKIYDLICE